MDFPAGMTPIDRLAVAAQCALVPGLFMMIAVARMARQRFFSPEDIDGGVTSTDTPRPGRNCNKPCCRTPWSSP